MISMARSMTNFVGSRLLSLFSLRATKNVSTRQDAIFENFTSKRDCRCCIYRFLILACQPKTLWNRQSPILSPTRKQGTTSPFIVRQALGARDYLQPTWQSGTWVSLDMRLSSGFDNISPMLPKHLSNNGWYFTTMGLNRIGMLHVMVRHFQRHRRHLMEPRRVLKLGDIRALQYYWLFCSRSCCSSSSAGVQYFFVALHA